jgi:dTDP-4-amino-4,6-dideoxygalactose transaminase
VIVPFCDLSRANDPLRADIDRAIGACLDRSWYLRGPETAAFEEEWAAYCGQSFAVSCNSGTDALTLAASALDLRTAAVQANTIALTGVGLHRGGASVEIVDVDTEGRPFAVTRNTVPVLLFGQIPEPHAEGAPLFDAAHAHGWRPPLHACAAWSFYPTKSLGALGDAGAVTTNDAALAEEMRRLAGRDDRLRDSRQITSRTDELQAAVLRVKLRHLNDWLEERAAIAVQYDARLLHLGITMGSPSLNHLYVVRVDNRDALHAFLHDHGVETKIHWKEPLHTLDGPWTAKGSFPGAEAWSESVLSLPCFPGLRRDEIDHTCELVDTFVAEHQRHAA